MSIWLVLLSGLLQHPQAHPQEAAVVSRSVTYSACILPHLAIVLVHYLLAEVMAIQNPTAIKHVFTHQSLYTSFQIFSSCLRPSLRSVIVTIECQYTLSVHMLAINITTWSEAQCRCRAQAGLMLSFPAWQQRKDALPVRSGDAAMPCTCMPRPTGKPCQSRAWSTQKLTWTDKFQECRRCCRQLSTATLQSRSSIRKLTVYRGLAWKPHSWICGWAAPVRVAALHLPALQRRCLCLLQKPSMHFSIPNVNI